MATDTTRARRFFERGLYYYELGKWNDAVSLLRDAVALFPEHVSARMHLGAALARQRLYLDAVRVLDEGRTLPNLDATSRFRLVRLLSQICIIRRDYPAAEYYLRAALHLRPDDRALQNRLAAVLCKSGRYQDSFALYLQVAHGEGFVAP